MATKKTTAESAQVQEQAVTATKQTGTAVNAVTMPDHLMAGPGPALESLTALADRYRVPSWQQAALCRFMGWADGKMLTDDEYMTALSSLAGRHLGGGRKK